MSDLDDMAKEIERGYFVIYKSHEPVKIHLTHKIINSIKPSLVRLEDHIDEILGQWESIKEVLIKELMK